MIRSLGKKDILKEVGPQDPEGNRASRPRPPHQEGERYLGDKRGLQSQIPRRYGCLEEEINASRGNGLLKEGSTTSRGSSRMESGPQNKI